MLGQGQLGQRFDRVKAGRVRLAEVLGRAVGGEERGDLAVEQLEVVFPPRPCNLRRDVRVQDDCQHVVEHVRQQALHVLVRDAEVWVGVDFDQPDPEVLINQEVVAEEFEDFGPLAFEHLLLARQVRVNYQVLDPGQDVAPEIDAVVREDLVKVLLKRLERQGVAFFKDPVVVTELLQAVVGQVDVVVSCVGVVLAARGPQVPVLVVEQVVLARGDGPDPDVELPALEQEWPFYILLHEPERVRQFAFEKGVNLLNTPADLDAPALVQSCRFDEPHILGAVLGREFFFATVSILDVVASVDQESVLFVFYLSSDNERSRDGVVNVVRGFNCKFVTLVKVPERPD